MLTSGYRGITRTAFAPYKLQQNRTVRHVCSHVLLATSNRLTSKILYTFFTVASRVVYTFNSTLDTRVFKGLLHTIKFLEHELSRYFSSFYVNLRHA